MCNVSCVKTRNWKARIWNGNYPEPSADYLPKKNKHDCRIKMASRTRIMFDMETERRNNNLMLSSLPGYGMEMNVGKKTKVMIMSAEPCTVQIMIDQKKLENVKITTIWVTW